MEQLQQLAHINGVATEFWDWSGKQRFTSPRTLLSVLNALGVPVDLLSDLPTIESAIQWSEDRTWRSVVPPCSVVREHSEYHVPIHLPHGLPVHVWVELEDGRGVDCWQVDKWVEPRLIDKVLTGEATFAIPQDLPLGYHRLGASIDGGEPQYGFLYVVPERLTPDVLAGNQRYWGVNVQAYSVRSVASWGIGDASDLADLTAICAHQGSDFVLINPLHASQPIAPIEDSPYLPVSRRWLALTYIRPEAIPEYAQLGPRARATIERLRSDAAQAKPNRGGGINRDASWEARLRALELIYPLPRPIHREAELKAFIDEGGAELHRFALWCALVEHFGTVQLPPDALDSADAVEGRVHFYQWAQWIAREQLQTPNRVAKRLGMPIGIMSDLAVGVHPHGAEYWAEPGEFAAGMSVGAPPDMYAQQGQDWSQPPWSPRALEQSGYAPFIGVLRAALDLSSALRIDHILGLFRLWWIPRGETPDNGTYVSFDHEAMVGILLLEAQRHGAIVIGEDLGTVEPWVRSYLADRGILGTSVLWFEKDNQGKPLLPEQYRENVLATVNTHDLPPTAGYMSGIQTTLRQSLGLLTDPVEHVRDSDEAEQTAMRARLREVGLLPEDPHVSVPRSEEIEALHRYICRTPSRLVAAALVDAVGEKQPQNLPGTNHEYPNWRIPLSDSQGNEVLLENLAERTDFQRLFAVMRQERGR